MVVSEISEQQTLEQEDRDLGFGSVVAQQSAERLLNRDGSFNVRRQGLGLRSSMSLYFSLLAMTWPRFILLAFCAYLIANSVFATGYWLLGPGSLEGTANTTFEGFWLEAFFFSVETISTVGYGHVAPVSLAANVLMTVESIVGLFGIGLTAGLIFARFSRPMASVIFSRHAVIAPYRGSTAFMFRAANRRRSQIVDLRARVILSRLEPTQEGPKRQFYHLQLERHRVSFFPLSWTVVHPIDEQSPLYGVDQDELIMSDAEFLILLTGIEETFSQMVHARSSYKADEVEWNARFVSMFQPGRGDGHLSIDVGRLDEMEPAKPPQPV